jgi:hypothetical protein
VRVCSRREAAIHVPPNQSKYINRHFCCTEGKEQSKILVENQEMIFRHFLKKYATTIVSTFNSFECVDV